jgi:hypothetical protein
MRTLRKVVSCLTCIVQCHSCLAQLTGEQILEEVSLRYSEQG